MALSLFLRSSGKLQISPLIGNISRLSTAASLTQSKSYAIAPTSNTSMLSSNLLKSSPVFNTPIRTCVQRLNMDNQQASGSHDKLWTAERALSAGLLGILPIAFVFPSQAADALLATTIMVHSYWGLEAVVTDYVRPLLFGNLVPKLCHGFLILICATTLGGLFYFIYNDIGIVKFIKKLWAIKGQ